MTSSFLPSRHQPPLPRDRMIVQEAPDPALMRRDARRAFMAGLLVNLGNPKSIFFFMGLLPGFFHIAALTAVDVAIIDGASVTALDVAQQLHRRDAPLQIVIVAEGDQRARLERATHLEDQIGRLVQGFRLIDDPDPFSSSPRPSMYSDTMKCRNRFRRSTCWNVALDRIRSSCALVAFPAGFGGGEAAVRDAMVAVIIDGRDDR